MIVGEPERALVTGGAGFIGHHLTRALLALGWNVTVLDDFSTGRRDWLPPACRLVKGDVRDPLAVATALSDVEYVFHLAARVSVRASADQFVSDADVNLMGSLNLLSQMKGRGIRKAIFASSMAVYADSPTGAPVVETYPAEPLSPYGIAKLAAERYWLMLCSSYRIVPIVLRFFNTYGPEQTYTPYVGVITIFINRLLRGECPIVFGDGEQQRDYIHVEDIVAANLAAARGQSEGIFNVGTGRATSVNQIARLLIDAIAPRTEIIYQPRQATEVCHSVADISRITTQLGFRPSRVPLDLKEVVQYWTRSNGTPVDVQG